MNISLLGTTEIIKRMPHNKDHKAHRNFILYFLIDRPETMQPWRKSKMVSIYQFRQYILTDMRMVLFLEITQRVRQIHMTLFIQ